MKENSGSMLRSGVVTGAVAGLGLGLVSVFGASPASAAETVEKTIEYSCSYPLIGTRSLSVKIKAELPLTIQTDKQIPDVIVTTTSTVGADTTEGLGAIGAKSLEGFAVAKVTLNQPGDDALPINANQILEKTTVPGSGGFDLRSYGKVIGPGFSNVGQGSIDVGNLDLKVTPRKADGTPTGMGTFSVPCTQKSGGTTTLATFNVVDTPVTYPPLGTFPPSGNWSSDRTEYPAGTLTYNLALKGSTLIKSANGTATIDGGMVANVNGATGAIEGPLTLKPTKGQFNILGFLPVTTDIAFEQIGATTGKYANGEIDTTSTMNVKYATFNAFGFIPVGGGDKCKTPTPSKIAMHSKRGVLFNPNKGGDFVADDYSLSGTADCGFLNPILGLFASGPGNTITAKLTPA